MAIYELPSGFSRGNVRTGGEELQRGFQDVISTFANLQHQKRQRQQELANVIALERARAQIKNEFRQNLFKQQAEMLQGLNSQISPDQNFQAQLNTDQNQNITSLDNMGGKDVVPGNEITRSQPSVTPAMSLIEGGVGDSAGQRVPTRQLLAQQNIQARAPQTGQNVAQTGNFGRFRAPEQEMSGQKPFIFMPSASGGLQVLRNPMFESPQDRAKRVRLEGREERLDVERDFQKLESFGGMVTPEQIERYEDAFGFDMTSRMEQGVGSGRINRRVDDDGNVAYEIIPKSEYERMVDEGRFTPEEQKHIRTLAEEHNAWNRIIDRMNELGVSQDQPLGEVKFEKTDNPFLRKLGFVSIPARFELAQQYADDPRYKAIARDIDIAFQKFRTRTTGAQASDKEIERLRAIMPALIDQPQIFFETIRNLQENARDDYRTLLHIKRTIGRRDTSQFEGLLTGMGQGGNKELGTGSSGATTTGIKYRIIE